MRGRLQLYDERYMNCYVHVIVFCHVMPLVISRILYAQLTVIGLTGA